jgi:predicted double-glycine peptidase
LCETDVSGTDVRDLEKAAKAFGFKTKVHSEDASVDIIKYHTDKQRPVIVMWYVGDQDTHVAVAYDVSDKYVYLLDPSLHLYTEPEIRIKRSMLERCWSNHEDARWIMSVYM